MEKIVCGKFDNIIDFKYLLKNKKKRIRIGSKNPNKIKHKSYVPIAISKNLIIYNKIEYSKRNFFVSVDKEILNNLIVLTNTERELILEELIDFDLDIKVFENLYPIFDNIKFSSDPKINYEKLIELMDIIKKFQLSGNSLAHNLSTKYLYKIERKLRFKNTLDTCFAFAYKGGYQEVFKLKEERIDRVVISMDFNSMFPYCMLGKFLEPKSVEYKFINNYCEKLDSIEPGLYHVILNQPKNTFFNQFHPFIYKRLFQSFYFNLQENQEIEILLFDNELKYYGKFFNKLFIIEVFTSKKTISHPLKQDALNLYKKRLIYKKKENIFLSNLTKFKLVTLHSSTNSKRFFNKYFSSKKALKEYIASNYMINIPEKTDELLYIKNQENLKFYKTYNKYYSELLKLNSAESIFSFSSQITANSRLKMLMTIENFLNFNSLEICYCNVDSIHISIKKDKINKFFEEFKHLFSDEIGNLKVESISDKGYWFDIGRYWLMNNNEVIKFKNIIFNRKNTNNQFIFNTRLKFIVKNNVSNYVKNTYKNIHNSFSNKKKLDLNAIDSFNFSRYNYKEIYNLDVAFDSTKKESEKNKQIKVDLLKKIATV